MISWPVRAGKAEVGGSQIAIIHIHYVMISQTIQ
jgi:hypothetical protein